MYQIKGRYLRVKIETKFEPSQEVYAIIDTFAYTDVMPVKIKSVEIIYVVDDGQDITRQHESRIFTTKAEAEAKLKEIVSLQ